MADFDKKVEKVMGSLDGFEGVDMPLDLEQKIRQRIEKQQIKSPRIVPFRIVLLAAAVFLGIVVLNVVSLYLDQYTAQSTVSAQVQRAHVQSSASSYFNDSSLNY